MVGKQDGTSLERLYYWREQHRLFAKWLRSGPSEQEVQERMSRYLDPAFHEEVAIPDYDLWISDFERLTT